MKPIVFKFSSPKSVAIRGYIFVIFPFIPQSVANLLSIKIYQDVNTEEVQRLFSEFCSVYPLAELAYKQGKGSALIWHKGDHSITVGDAILCQAFNSFVTGTSVLTIKRNVPVSYSVSSQSEILTKRDTPFKASHTKGQKKSLNTAAKWESLGNDWRKIQNVGKLAKFYGKPYHTVRAALVRYGFLGKEE